MVPVLKSELVLPRKGICWQLAILMAGRRMLLFELTSGAVVLLLISRSSAHEHKRRPAASLPDCSEASSLPLWVASAECSSISKQCLPPEVMAIPFTRVHCKNGLFLSFPLLDKAPTSSHARLP